MHEFFLLGMFLFLAMSTWNCIILYKLDKIKDILEAEG